MKRIILVLGIVFGISTLEARDWGFSKDTVYAFNNEYESRSGVPWPKFDTAYLENHGTKALKFDSASLQIIRPKINPDSGACYINWVRMDLNLSNGIYGPTGEYTFRIQPSRRDLPTGFENFNLLPAEKIMVGPIYLSGSHCIPASYMKDSVLVRLIFHSVTTRDTINIKSGPIWLISSVRNGGSHLSNQTHRSRDWSWFKASIFRDLKGRNSGP